MKKILPALIALFLLAACAGPSATPPVLVEGTVTSTATSIPPTPSQTPTLSYTSTPWIKTYPTKKALVIYGTDWRNEYTINFIEWGDFYLEPYLILYEDGQLILSNMLLAKQLSQEETNAIVSKLASLGFFQIQATYAGDEHNPLYSFPTKDIPAPNFNLPSVVLSVTGQESKSIQYHKEWEDYLVQPMKDITSYLDSFSLDGAISYEPDRLLVAAAGEDVEHIPEGATILPWPEGVPSPLYRSYMGVYYLEGTEALQLYKAIENHHVEYFNFEGQNYTVYVRPILPHECHIYHYYASSLPAPAQPAFICDDW